MKKFLNSKLLTLITAILFIILVCFFLNTFCIFKSQEVQAVAIDTNIQELKKNKNSLKIDEILHSNIHGKIREEMILEEIDLEYTTKYINNDKLPSGTIHVTQIGVDGKQDVITIKKYNNDELESEQIVASNVKKTSINKIVEIGTGRGTNKYKLKEKDNVYTTAEMLPFLRSANKDAEKISTFSKGTKVTVQKVFDNGWAYITCLGKSGYVLSEALSNINPLEISNIEENGVEKNKDILLAGLSFDMALNKKSGLSLEQFRKILKNNSNDKNNVFTENCDYFYYAEQEYGINGVFLAAIAIHESGWGTSKISLDKNNLFGYMAYDSSAYSSAKSFTTYAEGIDLLARVLVKYYLNEKGAGIYGGNIADGRYYNGETVSAVNKRYASDKNWANKVYNIMKNLYEKL